MVTQSNRKKEREERQEKKERRKRKNKRKEEKERKEIMEEESWGMSEKDKLRELEEENRKLKKDNETLLQIIVQLKTTLDRLLNHYVIEET